MSNLIMKASRGRWSIIAVLVSAIGLNVQAQPAPAAAQAQPDAAGTASAGSAQGRGARAVTNAPQVGNAKFVGDDDAEVAQASAAQLPAGATSQPTKSPAGQNQPAAASKDSAGREQSIAADAPLPSPRVDMVTAAVDQVAPLNPGEILRLRKSVDERQAAEVQPLRSDLIPVSVTYDIDLSPGARPQVIQVTPGQGALVNIIDREGNGWPVMSVKNYNEGAIKVERMGPSTLSIEATSNHKIASVGVLLEGMSVAWSFTVIPAQVTTDVRVDLRLPSLSPGSVTKIGRASGLPTVGAKLDGYLYGGTPEGARRLEVTGVPGARAWQSPDGKLILRIAGLVSSPAWYERMPAADGTAVYELPATPIVAVATDGGVSHTVRIKGLQPTVAASESAWRHQ
ncbi:DotH/IcmK family type IV secretion protein [Achromobacter ruhlandii]|uniref:DotH/IcmK family type IV secretion protein n=1 Tax=Achromobacter ruhlandii TaxID=72557 RepID=UPI0007BEDF4F|nr:DotH/IcmK family type IV secretion protein [Achromobacter ruhlandii]